jgi:hypothetical protein
MTRDIRIPERRQFGRRRTVWHAWVKVAGRDREPCVVRNISEGGALLEFEGAVPAAGRLILIIDTLDFELPCHVRHRSQTGLGVNFDETGAGDVPARRVRTAEVVARFAGRGRLRPASA